jgi:hypothetical protein
MKTCYQYELINYLPREVNWKTQLREQQVSASRTTMWNLERQIYNLTRQGEDSWCQLGMAVKFEALARWTQRKIEQYYELMEDFTCTNETIEENATLTESQQALQDFKNDTLSTLDCAKQQMVCQFGDMTGAGNVRRLFDGITEGIRNLIERNMLIPGLDYMTLESNDCDEFIID